jgi:hypothetical protein
MGSGETPEVYEKAVPGSALNITMLEGFEGEVGGSPRKGGYNVRIIAEDIETSAFFLSVEVIFQDSACVIMGSLPVEDGPGRFEELVKK